MLRSGAGKGGGPIDDQGPRPLQALAFKRKRLAAKRRAKKEFESRWWDTRGDDDGGTGSRAPSAAHAAGAFLPRKASQEPTPTRESFKRSVFKFKLLNRA